MSDLPSQFRHYVNCQMARVLTQMDRDPDSPTFGCFDRNYWHYKIRDFPSAILQQGIFTLEAARARQIAVNVSSDVIERWCVGAVNALARQVDRQGGVDEYYPFERSFPAAAFGLYAASRVLYDWQTNAPHLLNSVNEAPLRRLAQKLAGRVEQKAMNQQAAGLAGIALAAKVGIIAPSAIQPIADRLFQSQHPEGWFNEYGGPDFGYLTVTLDALADYHDVTHDERAIQATDRAIAFLAQLVGADGRLPSTLNCRNTDYVVPYGLVRAASRNPLASWLVETLFRDLGQPSHPIWATDDRYHCHYVFASIVRSLPYLDAMQAAQAPTFRPEIWLEGCGYWVYWSGDRQWTTYVAARKGGLVRIHRQNQSPVVDHGWRIGAKGGLWTSNWWSDEWSIQRQGQEICIRGNCQKTQFHVASPVKHAVLRLLAWLFGEKLVPFLKQKMIFRSGKADGPQFERRVQISSSGVQLQDQIEARAGAIATTSPRQNLRHVASADSFSPEEWQPALLPPTRQALDRKLQVSANWAAGSDL
ncbi:hypothetical protein H6G00_15410 [Leptolyngbya sp. FACHB-541]|uniref:hypothetical protein n=1 Tax=Leptolyngbya sp. FACHB-541 TaxID=2692810 RepID=UPI001685CB3B|nr:hypothetical protein [Leptolyngbya sp. FACHB-541]MBD1997999.1 hypothetical protein [Leptolyngbya sp. FACHB-541]